MGDSPSPSPKHTITLHEGVDDRLAEAVRFFGERVSFNVGGANAEDYADLARQREQIMNQLYGFTRNLVMNLLCAHGDGDLDLFPDMAPGSLFWRFQTGYHGGFIRHGDPEADPAGVTWSNHT